MALPWLSSLLSPILLLYAVLAAAGCGGRGAGAAGPEVRRPSLQEDACAERLHDLCGRLLLYYSFHHRLPDRLDALPPLDAQNPTPTVCPASGKPYVYRPTGLKVADHPGRLVVYDPLPSHSGMRWGVFVEKTSGGTRLTARVILLPEKQVRAAGPAPGEPGGAPSASPAGAADR